MREPRVPREQHVRDVARNWMITAVFNHAGQPVAKAEKFGTVLVAEVDLEQRLVWPSRGDFKAEIDRHRPAAVGELIAGHEIVLSALLYAISHVNS